MVYVRAEAAADLSAAVEFESCDSPKLGKVTPHLLLVETVGHVTQIDHAPLSWWSERLT